jgi:cell division protein FtsW
MQLPKYSILPGIIVFGSISVLLLLEPHYSGIVIVGVLTVIMLYVGGMKTKYLIVGAIALGVIILLLAVTGGLSYAMTRMDGWGQALSAERGTDLWDATWQTRNSLYAIGSGGFFGKGLGQSLQKLGFVPEAQNDMIFSIICEELGLFGAVCLIMMFMFMIYRFVVIAENAPDLFGSMLVVGIMAHIAIQVILNIAVVTNVIPNTGVTLPFISYGGTSVMLLMVEMGIALSVSNQIRQEEKNV